MLLAIDTSSRFGGVAVADADGVVVYSQLWRTGMNHTAQLMPAVADALRAQSLDVVDLDGVAVALGPGPFSALRVGVSAAKGLAMAANLPISGVDTLALEAMPHLTPDGIVCAWLDAGRREVAAAWFDGSGARVQDDAIAAPSDLLEREPALPAGALLYCGEAAIARRDEIRQGRRDAAGRPAAVAPWNSAIRLWTLAAAGIRKQQAGLTDDLKAVQPYYLRMPTITAARTPGRVAAGRPAVPASSAS